MIRHAEAVMGTVVSFALRDDGVDEATARHALRAACATLHQADAVFSTYKHGSPMSRLRRGEITPDEAPPEVGEVLETCRIVRDLSGGWFDPWAMPGGVDPTGLVKGWAAQRACDDLRRAGIPAAMVNAAGDIAGFGESAEGRPWRIGIPNPARHSSLEWAVELSGAIATSGTSERGSHVLDPHTRLPASRVLSATVTGPDLALADALATALVAGGHEALEQLADADAYAALLLDAQGSWTATPGFGPNLAGSPPTTGAWLPAATRA